MISNQLSFLTSSWFPSRCFICRHLLHVDEQSICQVCLQSLPRAHTAELTKLYVLGALIDADFVSALIFTDPVNTICYGLKYGDHPRLGGTMGHHVLGPFLVKHLKSTHRTTSTIVLIPMPISKRRRFQRGYNSMLFYFKRLSKSSRKCRNSWRCTSSFKERDTPQESG